MNDFEGTFNYTIEAMESEFPDSSFDMEDTNCAPHIPDEPKNDTGDLSRVPFDPEGESYNSTTLDEGVRFHSASFLVKRSMWFVVGLVAAGIFVAAKKYDTKIVDSAFDLFKLVIMNVLGYMFGSRSDSSSN